VTKKRKKYSELTIEEFNNTPIRELVKMGQKEFPEHSVIVKRDMARECLRIMYKNNIKQLQSELDKLME